MRSRIVRIGNSQGVRIPRLLLDESGIEGEVELNAEDGRIVIARARSARDGWAEAAQAIREAGDDRLENFGETRFAREEWEWR